MDIRPAAATAPATGAAGHDPVLYRALFESAGHALYVLTDGQIVDCNRRTCELFGAGRNEILDRDLLAFSPDRQPDGRDSRAVLQDLFDEVQAGRTATFDWTHRRRDGSPVSTEITFSPVEMSGRRHLLAMVRDVSSLRARESQQRRRTDHYQQSQKLESLGLMASGISHDFNNLLLAIMGNADLLDQDMGDDDQGRSLLDEIRKAAGRAADLCNQLLAYAGKGHFQVQPIDLSATTREMVQMIKVAVSRKITLRLDLADDLPMIAGDISKIHQVIMNLVVNASEAIGHRAGVIQLSTGRQECCPDDYGQCLLGDRASNDEFVYLEVKDDGVGMETDTLQRIFDPFFSTKIKGRGLGLASVLGIVRGHQGSLCVRSRPVEGTAFRVCFPVDTTGVHQAPRPAERIAAAGTGGTVLVVDDEEYLRVLCARMLRRLGYEVIMASDGPQALEIYQKERGRIDCVMLDLSMPVLDGVEVFTKLCDFDPQVKVIMTSGYHEQEIATRFAGRGISGFIQKPYVVADLDTVLRKVLASDQTRS